jgi:hypothetical protein
MLILARESGAADGPIPDYLSRTRRLSMAQNKVGDRYELTPPQIDTARRNGFRITDGKGIPQLRGICIALCIENMRLLYEINGHRAALGLPPLPGFEVK